MAVECGVPVIAIDQERFHEIDRAVMGLSFRLQNEFGRFFDEQIYQSELARRLSDIGLDAHQEVLLRVSHRDFQKDYFVDLLVENSVVFELKVVEALTPKHQKQLLNYLHLLDLRHGKLINFRTPSVESRFVSTGLTKGKRQDFSIDECAWDGTSRPSRMLKGALEALLREWGAFLDSKLYREALHHFISGTAFGVLDVEILSFGKTIGTKKMSLLAPDHAWHLSTHHDHLDSYELHLNRLLGHTPLRAIDWINLNQHQITLKTLRKK
jgi:GxxExxY protein